MIEIAVPGFRILRLRHVVLDYNGTMALDGRLLDGVVPRLVALSERLQVHVLTADTFGRVRAELEGLPFIVQVLPPVDQDEAKADYVDRLGGDWVAAFGNGRNDRLMLARATLGVAVVQGEGAAAATLAAADLVCHDILAALDLLAAPLRLVATLRS